MREIKFRSWDKKDKLMREKIEGRYWLGLEIETGKLVNLREGKIVDAPEDRNILMQYTGLKDKNGKEIYEGDVNRCDDGRKSEVVFYAGGFYLKFSKTEYTAIGAFAPFDRLKIGNIYENPDLLKQQ